LVADNADMDKQLITLEKGAAYFAQIKKAKFGHYQVTWQRCHNVAFDLNGNTWAFSQATDSDASSPSSASGVSKKRKLSDAQTE
jgi:hypothetical protein